MGGVGGTGPGPSHGPYPEGSDTCACKAWVLSASVSASLITLRCTQARTSTHASTHARAHTHVHPHACTHTCCGGLPVYAPPPHTHTHCTLPLPTHTGRCGLDSPRGLSPAGRARRPGVAAGHAKGDARPERGGGAAAERRAASGPVCQARLECYLALSRMLPSALCFPLARAAPGDSIALCRCTRAPQHDHAGAQIAKIAPIHMYALQNQLATPCPPQQQLAGAARRLAAAAAADRQQQRDAASSSGWSRSAAGVVPALHIPPTGGGGGGAGAHKRVSLVQAGFAQEEASSMSAASSPSSLDRKHAPEDEDGAGSSIDIRMSILAGSPRVGGRVNRRGGMCMGAVRGMRPRCWHQQVKGSCVCCRVPCSRPLQQQPCHVLCVHANARASFMRPPASCRFLPLPCLTPYHNHTPGAAQRWLQR